MTRAEIKKRIYLTGMKPTYQVHCNMPGSAIVCHVPSTKIGNAIVRALRELAETEASTIKAPKEK